MGHEIQTPDTARPSGPPPNRAGKFRRGLRGSRVRSRLLWFLLGLALVVLPAFYRDRSMPVHLDAQWSFQAPFDGTLDSIPLRLRELDGRRVVLTGYVRPQDYGNSGPISAEIVPKKAGSHNYVPVNQRVFLHAVAGSSTVHFPGIQNDSEIDAAGVFTSGRSAIRRPGRWNRSSRSTPIALVRRGRFRCRSRRG
jgi:hypothetical protein